MFLCGICFLVPSVSVPVFGLGITLPVLVFVWLAAIFLLFAALRPIGLLSGLGSFPLTVSTFDAKPVLSVNFFASSPFLNRVTPLFTVPPCLRVVSPKGLPP